MAWLFVSTRTCYHQSSPWLYQFKWPCQVLRNRPGIVSHYDMQRWSFVKTPLQFPRWGIWSCYCINLPVLIRPHPLLGLCDLLCLEWVASSIVPRPLPPKEKPVQNILLFFPFPSLDYTNQEYRAFFEIDSSDTLLAYYFSNIAVSFFQMYGPTERYITNRFTTNGHWKYLSPSL